MEIHLNINNEQRGPYSFDDVGYMLQRNDISPDDMAWKEGLSDWVTVAELLEQKQPLQTMPPVPLNHQVPPSKREGIGINQIGDYSRSTLQKDEIPIYYTTLHWLVFIKSSIIYIVYLLAGFLFINILKFPELNGVFSISVGSVVLAVICFLPFYISYKTSEFTVTNKRLIIKVGFIRRQTHELFISKLESVSVDQGLLGRLFDAGTIITSGTGGTKQNFPNVSAPLKLRSAIQEIQAENEK